MTDAVADARRLIEEELRLDPVYRYFRDLAGSGHRRVFESRSKLQGVRAAQRAGKTTVLAMEAAAYFRGMHPFRPRTFPARILVIAPSRAQLATIYAQRLLTASQLRVPEWLLKAEPDAGVLATRPLIPVDELKKRANGKTPDITWANSPQGRSPGCIRHVDGTEMYFHISGDPRSWTRIEGMDFHAIFRDEAIGDDNIGNTLVTRLMDHWNRPDEPDAGFYKWVATELTITQERIDFMKKCEAGEANHELIELETSDNPAITEETRREAAAMLGDDEAAKRVWGTEGAVGGSLIFKGKFDRKRHVLAEHYEPSSEANLWVSWDPGLRHPFGLLFAALEPERPFQIRAVRFHNEARKTLDYQANLIAEWLDGRFLEGFVYDSSGATKSDYSRNESLFVQMDTLLRQLGVKIKKGMIPSKNRYEDSLPNLWRYLDPDPNDRNAEPLVMINPAPSPGCDTAVNQMYAYRFKNGVTPVLKGDAIHKVNDEFVDCLRYLASRQPRWVPREPNHARHQPLARAKIPFARRLPDNPYATTPDMPADERILRERLAESARMIRGMQSRGGRRMREVFVRGL